MSFDALMNSKIYTSTTISSQNAYGDWKYTNTQSTTSINARVVPITVRQRVELPGFFDDVSYTCYCASSSSISKGDHIYFQGKEYILKELELDSEYSHKKGFLKLLP